MDLLYKLIVDFIDKNTESTLCIPALYDKKKFFCYVFKIYVDNVNESYYNVSIVLSEPKISFSSWNVFEEHSLSNEDGLSTKIKNIIQQPRTICPQCEYAFVYSNFGHCWHCLERLSNNQIYEDNDCAVCHSENDFFSIKLECKHMFHSKCLYKIVNLDYVKCPLCRHEQMITMSKKKLLTSATYPVSSSYLDVYFIEMHT